MPKLDRQISSRILDDGMTPGQWLVGLAEQDIIISARTLRQKAKEKGAYYCVARTKLITPRQIDINYEEGRDMARAGPEQTQSPMDGIAQYMAVLKRSQTVSMQALLGLLNKGAAL